VNRLLFSFMNTIKERFLNRAVLARLILALVFSLIYALAVPPFFLHLTDGISICSVILLLLGILNFWWKDGFFSFFSWNRQKGSFADYRNALREERRDAENPSLYAGILTLAAGLLLTLVYVLTH